MSQALARRLNVERRHHDRHSLADSRALRLSAKAKASYLAKSGILAHGTWWKLIDRYTGRRFERIGENIADGQDGAAEVVAAWMDSPEHRANILGDYTHVGSAQATGHGVIWWVSHYGKAKR